MLKTYSLVKRFDLKNNSHILTMDVFAIFAVILKLIGTTSNAQEHFNITRRSEGLPDLFLLPPSLCGESKGATECPPIGGKKLGDCQCACNMKDDKGVKYRSSTFGFYDGEWKCLNNSAVRNKTECSMLQVHMVSALDDPIPTLDQSPKKFFLSRYNKERLHCRYEFENSTYEDCDGTWKFLHKSAIGNFKARSEFWSSVIRLSYHASHPLLPGRLIKLVFKCPTNKSTDKLSSTCFLLKTKGNVSCPLPYVSTTSPASTSPTTTVSPSSFRPTETATYTLATLFERISTSLVTNLSISTTANDSNVGSSTADNRWMIAGLASGAVVFTTVITVTIVIIMKTCKRKNRARENEGNSQTDEGGSNEMHIYASATSIRNTDDRYQRPIDPIPVADYVNTSRDPYVVSDGLQYEILPRDESNDFEQKEKTSETLDSTMYCSLEGNVPHVYGSLNVPHKTHENETGSQYMCASQNNEGNDYQQLDTFGQRNHSEYQALKYIRE